MSYGVARLRRALDHEYAAAVTVTFGALVALSWSGLSSTTYQRAVSASWWMHRDVGLRSVVLNGLMTIFFAAIGLELSHEWRARRSTQLRASVAPLLGAVGGMAATAALSLVIGQLLHSPALRRGWGVPMATDVAFTLGVLALAGSRIPSTLRIFLLTLAVADDVLSVVVLSVTGVTHLHPLGLIMMLTVIGTGGFLARRLPERLAFALLLVAAWSAFAVAGVEPALSGVVAGILVPTTSHPSHALQRTVTRWSNGLALPLFAVVACGVSWNSLHLRGGGAVVIVGTTIVRLVGKVLGIGAGVALAGRLGAPRHESITVAILVGASLLCAIGFTVPLLFAGALFGAGSTIYGAFTVGLLAASVLGAACGVTVLRRATAERGPSTS